MDKPSERLTLQKCWSCREQFNPGEFLDNDGDCPACNAEQYIDDDHYAFGDPNDVDGDD